MSFTDYFEKEILDHAFGGATSGQEYTPPANWYIGLSTTAINDDGTGATEPVGDGYARVQVANTSANWSAASGSPTAKKNATAINFPQATGDGWGTVTHMFIADDPTAGNVVAKGTLGTSKSIGGGDTASFAVNDISLTLD